MTEVLIGRVEGPGGEELPKDLVGLGPAHHSRLGQEHEVHHGLPVQLQDPEDGHPLPEGLIIDLALDEVPIKCEGLVDEPQVLVLPVGPGRVLQVLQPAQGCEVLVRGFVGTSRA